MSKFKFNVVSKNPKGDKPVSMSGESKGKVVKTVDFTQPEVRMDDSEYSYYPPMPQSGDTATLYATETDPRFAIQFGTAPYSVWQNLSDEQKQQVAPVFEVMEFNKIPMRISQQIAKNPKPPVMYRGDQYKNYESDFDKQYKQYWYRTFVPGYARIEASKPNPEPGKSELGRAFSHTDLADVAKKARGKFNVVIELMGGQQLDSEQWRSLSVNSANFYAGDVIVGNKLSESRNKFATPGGKKALEIATKMNGANPNAFKFINDEFRQGKIDPGTYWDAIHALQLLKIIKEKNLNQDSYIK